MKLTCKACSSEQAPGAKFCRECGQPLQERCPACGAEEPPGARFCKACGASLAPAAPAESPPGPEMPSCPVCHADQVPGAHFCRSCGHALAPDQAAPSAPPAPSCPVCHADQIPGAHFCRSCGHALAPAAPPPPAPAPVALASAHAHGQAVPATAPAPTSDVGQVAATSPLPPDPDAMASSATILGVVAQAVQGKNLLANIRQDPTRLLQPAAGKLGSKLNWAEVLAVVVVIAVLMFFTLFGVWQFGFQAMLTSGVTPLLVYLIGLVLSMVLFRGLLDKLLRPVYGLLGKIPERTRLLLGLAAPVAWCLWDSKDWGSGFFHAGQTITIATLLSHVLLRSTEQQAPPPSPAATKAILFVAFLFCLRQAGWADDCSSPEDAMDTWYVGPPVKGLVSTIIAVAVNGKTILTKVLKPTPTPSQDTKPPFYRLNLSSQDRRTDLVLDGPDGLWVYAWITAMNPPPAYDPVAATEAISFSGPECLQFSEPQLTGTRKAVRVKAVTPSSGEAPTSATLVAAATLSGQPVTAPLPFQMQGGYELVITTSSEWSG